MCCGPWTGCLFCTCFTCFLHSSTNVWCILSIYSVFHSKGHLFFFFALFLYSVTQQCALEIWAPCVYQWDTKEIKTKKLRSDAWQDSEYLLQTRFEDDFFMLAWNALLGFLASCSVKLNSTHVLPFVSEFQIAHVSLKNLHALLRPLWVLFEYSAFFPQSKDMHF